MSRTVWLGVLGVACTAWLVGSCGEDDSEGPGAGASSSSSSGGVGGGAAGTGGGTGGSGFGGFDAGSGDDCTASSKLIYLLTDTKLLAFDPAQLQFTDKGLLSCPGMTGDPSMDMPIGMTIDRQAKGWVLYWTASGNKLFRLDIETLDCETTSYVHEETKPVYFLAFSSDGPGATTETLFGVSFVGDWFGRIEQPGLGVTTLGALEMSYRARVMITGTGDGKLYVIYPTDAQALTATIADIDKSDGSALASHTLADDFIAHSGQTAFAFWGGDFWLFANSGMALSVLQYKPADGSITLVAEEPPTYIAGAGVSTCAPTEPPL